MAALGPSNAVGSNHGVSFKGPSKPYKHEEGLCILSEEYPVEGVTHVVGKSGKANAYPIALIEYCESPKLPAIEKADVPVKCHGADHNTIPLE